MPALTLWPITIYRYGIMYATSIIIQLCRFYRISHSQIISISWPQVHHIITHKLDHLLTAIVAGIIVGGRLWHVLIYERSYYSQHLSQIFNLQAWGMSFVGWFVGVMIAVIIFMKYHKLKFPDMLMIRDFICAVLPYCIILGRLWNRINQELYGRVVDLWSWSASQIAQFKSMHLMTIYPHIDQQLRRNSNLLEGLGEGLLLGICTMATRYRSYRRRDKIEPWYVVAVFMIWYSIIRFLLENFRDNPATEYIGIRNKSQLWMIVMWMVGVWLIFYIRHRRVWS